MKKIVAAFMLLAFSAGFVSCDSEPVDPVLLGQNPNPTDPTDPTDPGTEAGSYWPFAVNNQWIFDSGMQPIKITGTDIVNSQTYYRMTGMFDGGSVAGISLSQVRYADGKYRVRSSAQMTAPPGEIAPFEYTYFRDDLPVGGTWSETVDQVTTYVGVPAIHNTNTYQGVILEKGVSVNVNGHNYTDVLHFKLTLTTVFPDFPNPPTVVQYEYWFARNVGPIKITSNGTTANVNYQLQSYSIN